MKLFAAPLALLAAAALCAPASASTVSVQGSTVTLAAPDRERNQITVGRTSSGALSLRDRRSPIAAGAGCTQSAPDRATCGGSELTDLAADLGPLNDSLSMGSSVTVRATVRGGSGSDTLRGGPRNDLLLGGTGRDTVTYSGRTGDVTVTLAGSADDGLPGEGDEVLEVERAIGGNGFDVLIGTEGANTLSGGPGDDRLDGAGGGDTLVGGAGHDLLQGAAGDDVFAADRNPDGSDALQGGEGRDRADYSRRGGNVVVDPDGFPDDGDRPGETLRFTDPLPLLLGLGSPERDNVLPDVESVRGGAGADVVAPSNAGGTAEGGPGTDVLYGGPGLDSLHGDAGFDRIVARDGRADSVRCGTENDRVFVDLDDPVDIDCETRTATLAPRVVPAGSTLEAEGLRVRVDCPAHAFVRCAGTLRAETLRRVDRRRRARLGLKGYGVQPGISQEVVIPLDPAARGVVARLAPLRVRVTIRGRDEAGRARASSAVLVLRG